MLLVLSLIAPFVSFVGLLFFKLGWSSKLALSVSSVIAFFSIVVTLSTMFLGFRGGMLTLTHQREIARQRRALSADESRGALELARHEDEAQGRISLSQDPGQLRELP